MEVEISLIKCLDTQYILNIVLCNQGLAILSIARSVEWYTHLGQVEIKSTEVNHV